MALDSELEDQDQATHRLKLLDFIYPLTLSINYSHHVIQR